MTQPFRPKPGAGSGKSSHRSAQQAARTPEQEDERRGLAYALAAHAAIAAVMLVGFLTASPSNPNPVQIELWADGNTLAAAEPETEPDSVEQPEPQAEQPAEPEPQPAPQPEPEPEPQPEPEPAPQAEPPPPPEVDPDIALEKAREEKKKREEEERRLAEQKAAEEKAAAEKAAAEKAAAEKAAAEKAAAEKKAAEKKAAEEKAAAEKKAAEEKAAAEKAAAEKAAAEKAAAEKKAAEKKAAEEKAAAEKAAAEKAEAEKKAAAEKAAAAKKAAAEKKAKEEQAKRDAIRAAMRGDALGAAGIAGGTADRNQSGGGGTDSGYAALVRKCIRDGVVYPTPPRSGSNPTVQYRANLDSSGHVTGVRILRSSGIPAFDRAVESGIRGCNPFPKPPTGKYPSYVDGNYLMYDQ
ncbi:cell envelope integrity protein TolA [Pusillimonas noertemannii]|uniref:cell envelope integrity protein TolA n=2 Tax=Pusillimonas noertemannii TaxID=305977 RepID=UPI0002D7485E|nr:cell envelope integrity protein TolA [Pusillimonas noertemannii]